MPMISPRGSLPLLLLFLIVPLLIYPPLAHAEAWELKYEQTLNKKYVDEERGLIGFRIQGEGIYVDVNSKMCSCSYMFVAMEWAKRYYQERQKHLGGDFPEDQTTQRSVTAYVVKNDEIVTDSSYDAEQGYH
jgi:hypothetical protein